MLKKSDLINKKAILSITGNLLTDQRVHKVACSLQKLGMHPEIIGRKLVSSSKLSERTYRTIQINLLFNEGPLFYAEYNFRLFIFLLFHKANVFVSNDLDTLLANYLAYRIRKIFGAKNLKLVYDSHEIFTEVPELNNKKWVKKVWLIIEKFILPKLKNCYTVCDPIADYYNQKYNIKMQVIRNMPMSNSSNLECGLSQLKLPENKKIILYQGALNIGRGIEHIIPLMKHLNDTIFVIIGQGDIEQELKQMVSDRKLEEKVFFTGNLRLEELNAYTPKADIGLVLQEDISLSYHYVLPNRLFDFIKAEVPVLASGLIEIERIVKLENIGITVNGFEPNMLLENIKILLNDSSTIQKFKENLARCKTKYCWENQETILLDLYRNLKD